MSTQKPLKELVPELMNYVKFKNESHVVYNKKLLDIWEGQLQKYIEESLMVELTPRAYARAKERIAPINILNKMVDKLSTVYIEAPSRECKEENEIDKELLEYYEHKLDLNNSLRLSNEMLNLHKYFALEPYLSESGTPSLRVIPADKFLVWSDNPLDPTKMTVFIKFMGTKLISSERTTDSLGNTTENAEDAVREVAMFHLYSDQEFIECDSEGGIHNYQPNPYGKIPFVYGSNSQLRLLPMPDADSFSMTTLVPKLLTDINYATQFQSHSIVYGIDIDPQNLEGNPDAFWVINSAEGENKNPQIGTIKPEVDTDKVISMIQSEMAMWIDSKGLKVGNIGSLTIDNAASGVAKMIDEADTTNIRKKQVNTFKKVEADLWSLLKTMHNTWVVTNQLKDVTRGFSDEFKVAVTHADQRVVVDTTKELADIKTMIELGLITKYQALTKLHPEASQEEIELMISEINAERPSIDFTSFNTPEETDGQED